MRNLPSGASVTGVKCAPGDDQITRISFQTKANTAVTVNLNPKLLHSVLHLLSQGEDQAKWGLGLNLGDAAKSMPTDPARVH